MKVHDFIEKNKLTLRSSFKPVEVGFIANDFIESDAKVHEDQFELYEDENQSLFILMNLTKGEWKLIYVCEIATLKTEWLRIAYDYRGVPPIGKIKQPPPPK